jgi:hypothetical protein
MQLQRKIKAQSQGRNREAVVPVAEQEIKTSGDEVQTDQTPAS